MSISKLSPKKLKSEIIKEAKVLGIEKEISEEIATRTVEEIMKWREGRSMITSEDLNEKLSEVLKKYNKDLAYLFKNKDQII